MSQEATSAQLTPELTEVEPRRSVRATKGQHTKSFDELETANAPKKRQTKKSKKAQEQEQDNEQEETEPEEVIRCVCGATEQDDDSGEAWIMCDTCSVWQHNVCMGVSSFDDEIPDHYWCEQCRPHDHKELLDGIAKGEKPWEARRAAHEEEEQKKKKKGGRKGKGKRNSETKDELEKERARSRSKQPEPAAQTAPSKGKRKSREESQDTDGKVSWSPPLSPLNSNANPISSPASFAAFQTVDQNQRGYNILRQKIFPAPSPSWPPPVPVLPKP
jgi:hypothetical protein